MVLVKTKLGKSGIHGIGLFADQFIPAGTPTFRYTPWFDITYSEEDLSRMSDEARRQILWYAYIDKPTNKYILLADDYRFINHSKDAKKINIESSPNEDVALRDIQPGEELLCDYNKFDDTYFKRLGISESNLV